MKTQSYIYLPFVFICMLATLVFACEDDKAEAQVVASITYSSEDISLSGAQLTIPVIAEGSSYQLTVTSTPGVTWEVKTAEEGNFVTATPQGVQEQSGKITLTVPQNETQQARTTTVQLVNSLKSDEKELIFEQEAAPAQETTSKPALSFAVLSDLHYGRKTGTEHADIKTPRALKALLEKQPNIKNIFVCGDMTDGGNEAAYRGLQNLFQQNLPADVKTYFMLGNHELYNKDTKQFFNDVFAQPIHQYIEINGYPFITLSISDAWGNYDLNAVVFLKNHLEKAARKYPGKPIFVFSHTPAVGETAYSPWYHYNQLYNTLKTYPQVVHFTGHLHFTQEDERSIKQNDFTWVNVGPGYYGVVSDLDINVHGNDRKECYRDSGEEVTEGLIVNCDDNMDVEIVRLDTKRKKEIKKPWIIKAPHDGSQFIYTEARTGGDAPIMSQDFTIENITANSCTIIIPQATDDDLVAKYLVEISGAEETKTYKVYSEYFLREDMPASVSWDISGLKYNTEYTVQVKAVDSFENESESKTQTFTTKEWTADPNATAPKADFIDIMFVPDNMTANVAPSGLTAVLGNADQKPEIEYNSDLKMYVSKYTGDSKKFFKIDYSSHADFKSKIEQQFTYEVYCKTNNTVRQCPFSGLEGAFIGLQMNESGIEQYYAMFNCTNGGYKRILYPAIEASRYYHYVFTFDGQEMNAYLDGILIGTLTGLRGKVKLNSNANNQWMYVGGDSPNNAATATNAQFPFQGEIAFCRIHGKAANSSEVYRLYEQIEKRKTIGKFDELKDKLPSLSAENAKEGWQLMNNIATTEAQIAQFLNALNK